MHRSAFAKTVAALTAAEMKATRPPIGRTRPAASLPPLESQGTMGAESRDDLFAGVGAC